MNAYPPPTPSRAFSSSKKWKNYFQWQSIVFSQYNLMRIDVTRMTLIFKNKNFLLQRIDLWSKTKVWVDISSSADLEVSTTMMPVRLIREKTHPEITLVSIVCGK